MNKKEVSIPNIIAIFGITLAALLIMYFIFNIAVFILGSIILTVFIPILFALLNSKKYMNKINYVVIGIVGFINVLYTKFITESSRFIEKSSDLTQESNISIQDINIVTFILGILFSIVIYIVAEKFFNRPEKIKR